MKELLIALGITGLIFAASMGFAMFMAYQSCVSRTGAMQLNSTWGLLQGCMVEAEGAFVPLANYRFNRGAK